MDTSLPTRSKFWNTQEMVPPINDDDNCHSLQRAIQASLLTHAIEESQSAHDFASESQPASHDQPKAVSPRVNIDDRIKQISSQPELELPFVNDPAGDTWIFIDPPSKQPEQDELDYFRYTRRYEFPIFVKKATLLKYFRPNPAVEFNLEALFGPSAQFRTIRSRRLTQRLRLCPAVKYVIDLTPPSEGDDAVYLTTELCCSEGVRLWYQAGQIWNVSSILVGGAEDYTSIDRSSLRSNKTAVQPNSEVEADEKLLSSRTAAAPMPLEYSPVRHRAAIERVIAALVGLDPMLDSAPKVWTVFAVAKYFGLTDSPVKDFIVRWLRAYPNSFFLEVCPETSLKIADGLEIHDLARDTFAILVGEEALDSLHRSRLPKSDPHHSVYGRRKEDLPEKIFSRIEYASKAFIERITYDFEEFAGTKMQWIDHLPEVQKLPSNGHMELQKHVEALKLLLKDYVRGTICKLLCSSYDSMPAPHLYRADGKELVQTRSRPEVWLDLSLSERILSRTFWDALLAFPILTKPSNLEMENVWALGWTGTGKSSLEQCEMDLGTYREVRNSKLHYLIRMVDRTSSLTEDKHARAVTLPDRSRSHAQASNCREDDAQIASVDGQYDLDPTPTSDNQPMSIEDHLLRLYGKSPSYDHAIAENMKTGQAVKYTTRADCLQSVADRSKPAESQTRSPPPPGCSSWSSVWDHTNSDSNLQADVLRKLPKQYPPPRLPAWGEVFECPNKSRTAANSQLRKSKDGWIETETEPEETEATSAATELFDLEEFFSQAKASIEMTARRMLQFADSSVRDEPHEIGITNTLVCLDENEWKYLPLWAGGCDDDTGGVLNDPIPAADLGFSEPGPQIHTGATPAHSSRSLSDFSMVDSSDDVETICTVNTSMANNRSVTSVPHGKESYAADSMNFESSSGYEMVTPESELEEAEARRQTEIQEEVEAAEDQAAKEAQRTGATMTVDEDYGDLFGDEIDDADDYDSTMDESDEDEDTVMV